MANRILISCALIALVAGTAAGQLNFKPTSSGGKSPLASLFAGNDGGAYYVTEVGKSVYWFAEHPGRGYAHVGFGTRQGNMIRARYWSVPKGKATNTGTVRLKVNGNGSLTRTKQTGGFPAKSFQVRSIKGIVNKLPGKKRPGFTTNILNDLDGAFEDANGSRFYVRQLGDRVILFGERSFKKGKRPQASLVFIGKRQGSTIVGQAVAVPKGLKKGAGNVKIGVRNDRALVMQGSGISFAKGPLMPVLPDIRIPISKAMNVLNSQMNKVQIRLDSFHNGGPLNNGSFVKFGNGQPQRFSLPYHDLKITKKRRRQAFINDMDSDIVNLKPLGSNLTRLSVIFESGGHEIKRKLKGALVNDDKRLRDWDIKNPRVDIEFRLVNYNTSGGTPSISFEITNVKLHAWVDIKLVPDKLDQWIAKKIRPIVESKLKKAVNDPSQRRQVANFAFSQLQKVKEYLDKYKLYGYSASALAPKRIFISGGDVVVSFK